MFLDKQFFLKKGFTKLKAKMLSSWAVIRQQPQGTLASLLIDPVFFAAENPSQTSSGKWESVCPKSGIKHPDNCGGAARETLHCYVAVGTGQLNLVGKDTNASAKCSSDHTSGQALIVFSKLFSFAFCC